MLSYQKVFAAILFPVGVLVCIAALIMSSLLWIPYIIVSIIDKLLWVLFNKEAYEWVSSFEEFIFACYGFAAVMVYLPLSAFEEELY
jgi:hypothetical protein